MKKLYALLATLSLSLGLYAKDVSVSGTVLGRSDDEPLIGATLLVEGTTNGTSTDIDGNFNLTVADGATLKITYVGYRPTSYKVKGETKDLKIYLDDDTQSLDDVVVIGYGTQKKSVVTAAISTVDEEKLSITSPVRMDNALKGLTSGVTVTSASGQPGEAARVRVRGIGTVNNSEPLYIVDG
ncbi:MAG: carboxypeptidase-like regulatory domain-containing protein, partial [Muribaculaceae bacterium]|nr:carboxypeptidase-like regulatory domain-containing protein [Muribaculaceae bacterium]